LMRRRRRDPSSTSNKPSLLEEWVRGTYDTAWNDDLPGIARTNGDGSSKSWHVTDSPKHALKTLQVRRTNLIASYGPKGQHAELGPGFYVGNPHFWSGRSSHKWKFLSRLDRPMYLRLASYLRMELHEDRRHGRITERELERGQHALKEGLDNPSHLVG